MSEHEHSGSHTETIHLPAPTAWPIIMAFGVMLSFAGMVTNFGITLLGIVLTLAGAIGWFRQVLPHEAHEDVPVVVEDIVITSKRTSVERLNVPERPVSEGHFEFPLENYPSLLRAGIKGGIAGGIAMIPPAILYGLIAQHSIWYPVNLLGGAGVANWRNPSTADIAAFHWQGLLVAIAIHTVTCLLVGLLYGAMLPMLPRHPILLGGVIAPVLWTGLLHSTMGVVNPVLDARIQWGWFLISQVTFGLVAGLVVARTERIRAARSLPFAMRMGIEASGMNVHGDPKSGDGRK
jgi:hypothetical protein